MFNRKQELFKRLLTNLPHEMKQQIFSFFPYQKLSCFQNKVAKHKIEKQKNHLCESTETKLSQVSINNKKYSFFNIIKQIYHPKTRKILNVDFSKHHPKVSGNKAASAKFLDNYIFNARQCVMFEFRILQEKAYCVSDFIIDSDLKDRVTYGLKQLSIHIREILFSPYKDRNYEEALILQECLSDIYEKNMYINAIKKSSNKDQDDEKRNKKFFLQSPEIAFAQFSGLKYSRCAWYSGVALIIIGEMFSILAAMCFASMGVYYSNDLANYNSTSDFDPQQLREWSRATVSIILAVGHFLFSIVLSGFVVACCCCLKATNKLFNTKKRLYKLNKEYSTVSDSLDDLLTLDVVRDAIYKMGRIEYDEKNKVYEKHISIDEKKALEKEPNQEEIVIIEDVSENTPLLGTSYK